MTVLAVPLHDRVLAALADGARRLVDLRSETGAPPPTTLRGHLRELTALGVLDRQALDAFPGSLDYELAEPGRQLLKVADALRGWLALAPDGALELGTDPAKSATKALVEGWQTSMMRILAAKPFPLTDLARLINNCSYPSLERRLAAMRLSGLVEPAPGQGRGTPYQVTTWLRQGLGPLVAAMRWERRYLAEATPMTGRDAEALFLLAAPMLSLPSDTSGTCRLVVDMGGSNGDRLAGASFTIEEGRVTSSTSRLEGKPDACAIASPSTWLAALTEDDANDLEFAGESSLARDLLEAFHEALFGAKAPAALSER